MATAILFGKVGRIQSHAHLSFSNTVCLQYAEVDADMWDEESSDSDCESNHNMSEEDEEVAQAGDVPGRTVSFHKEVKAPTHSLGKKTLVNRRNHILHLANYLTSTDPFCK